MSLDEHHPGTATVGARPGDAVHELAHKEDAASAVLEQVVFTQRIRDLRRVEALPLVLHRYFDRGAAAFAVAGFDLNREALLRIHPVPVPHSVRDRFPNRRPHPVRGIRLVAALGAVAFKDAEYHLNPLDSGFDVESNR